MSGRQITAVATHTARSISRRLTAAARERSRRGHSMPAPLQRENMGAPPRGPSREAGADDARLDALRGELVRELDRMATADEGCSASFRRA
jgi:hypothetical protein